MWRTIYTLHDHFKGYLTSHDSSMVTICCSLTERIYDIFVIFFSQSSKQVHKVIIGKEVIWSSYNIHFVSLHHKYHHHHHHLSIILCNNQLKVSTSPKQPISSRVQVLYHWIWRFLTLDTQFNSLTNGSEEKSLQGLGFKAWSISWKSGCY